MNRKDILDTAKNLISGDRHEQYGDARENFQLVANLWSSYMDGKKGFTAEDVAMLLALLKIARIRTGQVKADNFIDTEGYIALAGELYTGVGEDEMVPAKPNFTFEDFGKGYAIPDEIVYTYPGQDLSSLGVGTFTYLNGLDGASGVKDTD
jgi:hypothetical protein